jgi:hypothetical protein
MKCSAAGLSALVVLSGRVSAALSGAGLPAPGFAGVTAGDPPAAATPVVVAADGAVRALSVGLHHPAVRPSDEGGVLRVPLLLAQVREVCSASVVRAAFAGMLEVVVRRDRPPVHDSERALFSRGGALAVRAGRLMTVDSGGRGRRVRPGRALWGEEPVRYPHDTADYLSGHSGRVAACRAHPPRHRPTPPPATPRPDRRTAPAVLRPARLHQRVRPPPALSPDSRHQLGDPRRVGRVLARARIAEILAVLLDVRDVRQPEVCRVPLHVHSQSIRVTPPTPHQFPGSINPAARPG